MIDRVLLLVKLLRDGGVSVSTPEIMDALTALTLVPGCNNSTVKTILQASLVKDKDFNRLYEEAYARAFTIRSEDISPARPLDDYSTQLHSGVDSDNVFEGSGSGGKGRGGGGGTAGSGQRSTDSRGSGITPRNTQSYNGPYLPGERTLANLSFVSAGQKQKEEMLLLIRELSKKLALKKGVKKIRGGHRLHFRRLWRNSMGTGGTPFELAWQQRRPNKPRIFIICDLSNSMIAYLPFVMEFAFTFASVHSTVRVFGFVDALEEITARIDPLDIKKSVDRICSESKLILRGQTDYGNAFRGFYRYHRDELTSRSFVIIVGDARNNYFQSEVELLKEIRARSAGVYWLNPEGTFFWGMGDSYMNVYAPHCDGVFECQNIAQLKNFMDYLSDHLLLKNRTGSLVWKK